MIAITHTYSTNLQLKIVNLFSSIIFLAHIGQCPINHAYIRTKSTERFFPVKKSKSVLIKVSFVSIEFCQASVNRSDTEIASQYLQNEACEQTFSFRGVVSLI